MTNAEKLTLLKTMYGNSEEDAVFNAYLSIAAGKVLERLYPFDDKKTEDDIPAKHHHTQVNIANYLLGKRGAEGEIKHNENGIERTYESGDVPESMLKDIVPHCGVL